MGTPAIEINPDDLEPTIEIDLPTQKKILSLEARLDVDDYYSLLEVAPSAEKKEIRSAYFDRMNEFHSDKFYGKEIGGFSVRLQRIVSALTKANDVLGKKKTRREYDTYLESRQTTLGARASVAPAPRESDRPEDDGESSIAAPEGGQIPVIPRAPKTPEIREEVAPARSNHPGAETSSTNETKSPSSGPRARGSDASSSPPARSPAPGTSSSPRSTDAARRLLARKMGRKPPSGRAAVTSGQVRQALDADLKARYQARKAADRGRIEKYMTQARAAEEAGEWASAVNSLKIALEASPDDEELQKQMVRVQEKADVALAPKFVEQAKYEEKDGRYERAARSYERAARGKKSGDLFATGAECLLKAGKLGEEDRRKVVELAREAVSLDNQKVHYRVTLAKAYDAAGMKTSALGEVRRALEIDSDDENAKELLKALK